MSGEENLANAIRDWLLSESLLSYPPTDLVGGPISPIEYLFYCAVVLGSRLHVSGLVTGFRRDEPATTKDAFEEVDLWGVPQWRILDWPVDFLFVVRSHAGEIHRLVVECDGHDFHERTKEQAARDRARDRRLQDAGCAVYRFTGSEIYRDALKCARQVFDWAEKAHFIGVSFGTEAGDA